MNLPQPFTNLLVNPYTTLISTLHLSSVSTFSLPHINLKATPPCPCVAWPASLSWIRYTSPHAGQMEMPQTILQLAAVLELARDAWQNFSFPQSQDGSTTTWTRQVFQIIAFLGSLCRLRAIILHKFKVHEHMEQPWHVLEQAGNVRVATPCGRPLLRKGSKVPKYMVSIGF